MVFDRVAYALHDYVQHTYFMYFILIAALSIISQVLNETLDSVYSEARLIDPLFEENNRSC